MIPDELYKKAIKRWGHEAQIKMAIEECAELQQALCKFGRQVNGSSVNAVAEEIADVEIMLEQLRVVFDTGLPGDFNKIVAGFRKRKLQRLEELVG